MNTFLTLIELCFIGITTFLLIKIYLEYRNLRRIAIEFFDHKEGEQSAFGLFIENISRMAGNQIAIQAKTTLMGKMSGLAREEKAIEQAIAYDSNPALMTIIESMPALKKLLTRNPALLGIAQSALSKINSGDHGAVAQTKFKL